MNKSIHLAAKIVRPGFPGLSSFQIACPVVKPCQARIQVTSLPFELMAQDLDSMKGLLVRNPQNPHFPAHVTTGHCLKFSKTKNCYWPVYSSFLTALLAFTGVRMAPNHPRQHKVHLHSCSPGPSRGSLARERNKLTVLPPPCRW